MTKGCVPESETDPDVVRFGKMFGLEDAASMLEYQDHGYGPEWCHVSAKHHALTHGGKRVHGWALWRFGSLVMGDFHSVWEAPDGELIDVTPPKFGAGRILFVRDDTARIDEEDGNYMLHTNRSSDPNYPLFWLGNPTQYTHWSCPPDKPDLVAYAGSLGFPVAAMVTDDTHG